MQMFYYSMCLWLSAFFGVSPCMGAATTYTCMLVILKEVNKFLPSNFPRLIYVQIVVSCQGQ